MNNNARGKHVSPGVYTREVDIKSAVKSLGLTTLGLVGETKKGPAFQPIMIQDWAEFQDYFGDVDASKFKGTGFPKYELPYIAKSYLTESKQLQVCRVLGLSGMNMGPAWYLTASNNQDGRVTYETKNKFFAVVDGTTYYFNDYIERVDDTKRNDEAYCDKFFEENFYTANQSDSDNYINILDVATLFNQQKVIAYLKGTNSGNHNGEKLYSVIPNGDGVNFTIYTFNSDYNTAINDTTSFSSIFTESNKTEEQLNSEGYEKIVITPLKNKNALLQIITPNKDEVNVINLSKSKINPEYIIAVLRSRGKYGEMETPINDCSSDKQKGLIFNVDEILIEPYAVGGFNTNCGVSQWNPNNNASLDLAEDGYAYFTVIGKKGNNEICRYPVSLNPSSKNYIINVLGATPNDGTTDIYVEELYDLMFSELVNDKKIDSINNTTIKINGDIVKNYKEGFRNAITPWFVSELKGDANNVNLEKLFRFHTISDGSNANTQVKISIANIKPEEGTFDVLVRDFNDSDANVVVLERFNKCSMMPGTVNYIGMKIGTYDGTYEIKSKYIMVELNENDATSTCIPCGFMGYPIRGEEGLVSPTLTYNVKYDNEIKDKRQYFGMSNIVGVDVDVLKYKGVENYKEGANFTNGFHLDCTINPQRENITVLVDGKETTWSTVLPSEIPFGNNAKSPIIGTEDEMKGTIYENINNRKFTACFYGGFDGWDEFRDKRSNGNEYKVTRYKGNEFEEITNEGLNLPLNAISSDYYAYLAGIRAFENPDEININILATPGIDYVNNSLLVEEVVDMIEESRQGDAIYIVTTPDMGENDNMISAQEAVNNLEYSGIDSSYAATYYPWVKFYDSVNSVFINLPVTKDIVRNMAAIDNKSYPWFSPAGMDRGSVVCEKARKFIKIEEEDTLYEGRINPIKSFSQDGVKIWGNKTLYPYESPLNRINVRRLMIYMRKLIMLAANKLIFEQNDSTLKAQFEGIVNPILADIKSNRGITDYKLEVSQTPEEMDAHELNVKIWVKPTGSLEYIDISFMVTPQSVNFNE